jgi:hypothetical protein
MGWKWGASMVGNMGHFSANMGQKRAWAHLIMTAQSVFVLNFVPYMSAFCFQLKVEKISGNVVRVSQC